MNAKAIPICDIFINCTHQISARNFELIGEETQDTLLGIIRINQVARKKNIDWDKEDLPF